MEEIIEIIMCYNNVNKKSKLFATNFYITINQ